MESVDIRRDVNIVPIRKRKKEDLLCWKGRIRSVRVKRRKRN